jgi:two-component system response regulator HydG
MTSAVTLLISRCPAVIEQVKAAASGLSHVQIEVCSAQRAGQRAGQPDVGLILAHLDASEEVGITRLLWSVAQAKRPCATVVLCDHFEEHQAAALLRAGAADYVAVPDELHRLGFLLNVLTRRLRAPGDSPVSPEAGAGASHDGLERIMAQVRRVAPQETTLLLTGETGTGKTRLARLIHQLSPRRDEPFLVVDCGSLSPSLIESELFGHAKGAFTGADRERPGKLASAGTGTLLLDEVNSLPLPLQGKLLRAVDERTFEAVGADKAQPVKARLIAASNAELEREVEAGRFRADLYFRLNVVGFFLPPLRDRRASIVPLGTRFLCEFAERNRPDVTGFADDARAALERYSWPGNVRELRNVTERAVALCRGPLIDAADLPEPIRHAAPRRAVNEAPARAPTLHQSKDETELRRILEALQKNDNKRARAARELGISRVGLYKKLQKYGLLRSGAPEAVSEAEA